MGASKEEVEKLEELPELIDSSNRASVSPLVLYMLPRRDERGIARQAVRVAAPSALLARSWQVGPFALAELSLCEGQGHLSFTRQSGPRRDIFIASSKMFLPVLAASIRNER